MIDDHISGGFTDAGEVFLEHIGDQNKDGREEFILSSPTNGTNGNDSGSLQFFWGANTVYDSLEIYNTDLLFLGGEGYLLGTDALLWNIDGDGYDDLVIGCPGAGSGEGTVLIYDSFALNVPPKGTILNETKASYVLTEPGSMGYGSRLARGDLTGNGKDDLVVIASGNETIDPAAYMIYEDWVITSSTFTLPSGCITPGTEVVTLDINGNGMEELVISSPEQGAIRCFSLNGSSRFLDIPGSDPDGVVRFTSTLVESGNTWGWGAVDDGWDTSSAHIYDSGGDAAQVRYNADTGNVGNADRSISRVNQLQIELGGIASGGSAMSGAYGVDLTVPSGMLDGASRVWFDLDYMFENWGFERTERMWIKGMITDPSGTPQWLSYFSDSGQGARDNTPEIWTLQGSGTTGGPNVNGEGSIRIDVTDIVDSDGGYYLELGGKILGWTHGGEYAVVGMDNISLEAFSLTYDSVSISGSGGFGETLSVHDMDGDGKEDLLVSSSLDGTVRVFSGGDSFWSSKTGFTRFDCNFTISGTTEQGFGTSMAFLKHSTFNDNSSILISDPLQVVPDGVGEVYLFELPLADPDMNLDDAVEVASAHDGLSGFGSFLLSLGDINGDTYPDMLIVSRDGIDILVHTLYDRSPTPPLIAMIYPRRHITVSGLVEWRVRVTDVDMDMNVADLEYYQSTDNVTWVFIGQPEVVEGSEGILYWDTLKLSNMGYFLKVMATDDYGLTSQLFTDRVDVFNPRPPKIFLNSPQDGVNISGEYLISAQVIPPIDEEILMPIRFHYSRDNETWVEFRNISQKNPSDQYSAKFNTLDFEDGPVWFMVNSTTEFGLYGEDRNLRSVFIDNHYRPEVHLIYPEMNTTISGIVRVLINVTDRDDDVVKPPILMVSQDLDAVDWDLIGNFSGPIENDTYYLDWDTTDLENGGYYLQTLAEDETFLDGVDLYNRTVTIHNPYTPLVEIIDIAEDQSIVGPFVIRATLWDRDGNYNSSGLHFYYRPRGGDEWTEIEGTFFTRDLGRVTWDTKSVVNGYYSLKVDLMDEDGLVGSDAIEEVYVNNFYAPRIEFRLESIEDIISGVNRIDFVIMDDEPILDENIKVEVRSSESWLEIGGIVRDSVGGDFTPWMEISFHVEWDTGEKDESQQDRFPDGPGYIIRVSVKDKDEWTESMETNRSFLVKNRETDGGGVTSSSSSIEPWMLFAGGLILFFLIIVIMLLIFLKPARKEKPEKVPLPEVEEMVPPEPAPPEPIDEAPPVQEDLYSSAGWASAPTAEEAFSSIGSAGPALDPLEGFYQKDEHAGDDLYMDGPPRLVDEKPREVVSAPSTIGEIPLWEEEVEVNLPDGVMPTARERTRKKPKMKKEKAPTKKEAVEETWDSVEDWDGAEDDVEDLNEWEESEEEEEALVIECSCGAEIEFPPDFKGGRFRCPECGKKGKIRLD